jgi:hypothetical protein
MASLAQRFRSGIADALTFIRDWKRPAEGESPRDRALAYHLIGPEIMPLAALMTYAELRDVEAAGEDAWDRRAP